MRNVARFRIRGHGLKCETGLYGRSPDRSARVCNLFENGDYIQDEKHVIFSCIGTEHLRHQFIHLFDNISKVISKVLFFNITQKFTNLAREEREELFLGAACVLCSLFCFAALVLLVLLVL